MISAVKTPKVRIRWGNVLFLAGSFALGFVVAPVYLASGGVSTFAWALTAFYVVATIMSITVGYHRLYAHVAYKAHPALQLFVLIFGAASFQQSALRWASLHRTHHRFTDTEKDPYNIKRGFWYAHVGWIVTSKPAVDYDNVLDLQKNPLVMWQHRNFKTISLVAGIAAPLALAIGFGHGLEAFLLGAARVSLVHHCTFFINSFAHSFGSREYDRESSSRDNWIGALLTNGEGYHNYHHRFPSDYRNGIRWYHYDPTKWAIWICSKVGLAADLKRIPPATIAEARRSAAGRPEARV